MNPIRDFFKKIKSNQKFKTAGPGRRLDENPTEENRNVSYLQSSSTSEQRHELSEEAKRAAAAALSRIEQKQHPSVNWSLHATKVHARKELELENSLKAKQASIVKEVNLDTSILTVPGVYFTCPIIGYDVLPKNEIQAKIREFLYSQLEHEKGLTACLIIHTLNRRDKVQIGVETLCRYLTNILDNPTEEKYWKIRIKNKVFQERILELEGAFDFLEAAGFSRQILKVNDQEEEYFVFQEGKLDNLEHLQMLKDAILSAEPIVPVLDRNLKVLKPSHVTEKVNLPDDFFNLSAEELKREQEAKTETVELLSQLRTKAMRERDEIRELHIYKFTLVRIRFPDEIILQGTFYVHEKLSAVKEFIMENLVVPSKEFDLFLSGGFKLTDDEQSLLELKLVPAVVINFQWSNKEQDQSYLKPEILILVNDL